MKSINTLIAAFGLTLVTGLATAAPLQVATITSIGSPKQTYEPNEALALSANGLRGGRCGVQVHIDGNIAGGGAPWNVVVGSIVTDTFPVQYANIYPPRAGTYTVKAFGEAVPAYGGHAAAPACQGSANYIFTVTPPPVRKSPVNVPVADPK